MGQVLRVKNVVHRDGNLLSNLQQEFNIGLTIGILLQAAEADGSQLADARR